MSAFRNVNFVNEFAYRTKLNYLYRKAEISTGTEKEKYFEMISTLKCEMENKRFKVDAYYEITDIINSLIGLLVFPEQNVYKYIDSTESSLEKLFPTIYSITLQSDKYNNTYISENGGRNPQCIFKHIKNSLSHKRIMIFPESPMTSEKIEYVVFKDCNKDFSTNTLQEFFIRIPVSELENIVFEISDYLISLKS